MKILENTMLQASTIGAVENDKQVDVYEVLRKWRGASVLSCHQQVTHVLVKSPRASNAQLDGFRKVEQ